MRSDLVRRHRSSGRRGGGLFLFAFLLLSCGKLLGLKDGAVQAACTTDAQCAPGYGCLEKLGCRNRCTADSDCGAGSRCFKAFITTACIPVTEGCGSADTDSGASDSCPQGTTCDGRVCRTQCSADQDQCAGGQECVAGACVGTDPLHESGGMSGGGAGAGPDAVGDARGGSPDAVGAAGGVLGAAGSGGSAEPAAGTGSGGTRGGLGMTNGGGGATETGGSEAAAGRGGAATGGTSETGGAMSGAGGAACNGTLCGSACVDLASSGGNCGVCGHDCGGGMCSQGICQPQILKGELPTIGGIAVDTTKLYFTQNGSAGQATSALESCPLNGCTLAPTQIAGNFVAVGSVALTPEGIAFDASQPTTGNPTGGLALIPYDDTSEFDLVSTRALHTVYIPTFTTTANYVYYRYLSGATTYLTYRCTVSQGACAANVLMQTNSDFSGTTTTPFAAEGANLFFVQGGALVSCNGNTACASTTTVLAGFQGSALRASAGILYFTQATDGLISSCPETGCAASTKVVDFASASDLAVDAAGVYWVSGTSIKGCHLPNCPGGPHDLATSQTAPTSLVADGKFVYWTTGLVSAGGGGLTPNTASIARVRHW